MDRIRIATPALPIRTWVPLTDLPVAGIARPGPGASRRNRYQIQAYRPLPELISSERTLGEVLTLLPGANAGALTGNGEAPARACGRVTGRLGGGGGVPCASAARR